MTAAPSSPDRHHSVCTQPSLAAESHLEPALPGTLRLLWIDDELEGMGSAIAILGRHGITVVQAMTGTDGIRIALTVAPDIVLLDIRLGQESGLDILEALRAYECRAPVVVLTGFADVQSAIAAMKLGADDYYTKPIDMDELARSIRALVARGSCGPVIERTVRRESDWLDAQCLIFGQCVNRNELVAVLMRLLLSSRVRLAVFVAGARALRFTLTTMEPSLTLITAEVRQLLSAGLAELPPTHPKLQDAVRALELPGIKRSQELFAKQTGLSRAYLAHLLRAQTGRTGSEWCRAALMRDAFCNLLRTTEHISQIAYQAGYNHPGQLDRDFVTFFGATPSRLRHLQRAGVEVG